MMECPFECDFVHNCTGLSKIVPEFIKISHLKPLFSDCDLECGLSAIFECDFFKFDEKSRPVRPKISIPKRTEYPPEIFINLRCNFQLKTQNQYYHEKENTFCNWHSVRAYDAQ